MSFLECQLLGRPTICAGIVQAKEVCGALGDARNSLPPLPSANPAAIQMIKALTFLNGSWEAVRRGFRAVQRSGVRRSNCEPRTSSLAHRAPPFCLLHRRDFSKQHAIEGELQVKKRPPQHCGPKMRPPPDPINCLEASVLSSNGLAVIKASLPIVFSDRGLLLGNLQEAQW